MSSGELTTALGKTNNIQFVSAWNNGKRPQDRNPNTQQQEWGVISPNCNRETPWINVYGNRISNGCFYSDERCNQNFSTTHREYSNCFLGTGGIVPNGSGDIVPNGLCAKDPICCDRFSTWSRPSSNGSGSGSRTSDELGGTFSGHSIEGLSRFATDRPHLVSIGGGRLSTSATLHPINEGKTIVGAGGMGVVPDIAVLGTGVDPEHCILQNEKGVVTLTALASLVTVDGIRVVSSTRLTQGCLICFGRSTHFRFNQPPEAGSRRCILPNVPIRMAPVPFYPAVDNPEYFNVSPQEAGLGEGAAVEDSTSSSAAPKPPVPPRKAPPLSLPLLNLSPINNNQPLPNGPSSEVEERNQSSEESGDSDAPPEKSCAKNVAPGTTKVVGGAATVVSLNGMTTVHNALYRSIPPTAEHGSHSPTASPKDTAPIAGVTGPLVLSNPSYCLSGPSLNMVAHLSRQKSASSQGEPLLAENASVTVTYPSSSPPTSQVTTPPQISKASSPLHNYVNSTLPRSPEVSSALSFSAAVGDYAYLRSPPVPVAAHTSGIAKQLRRSSFEDLVSSALKRQQVTEERLREEEDAEAEKARLEEILSMCAEYDRQNSRPDQRGSSPSKSPYHTLTQNRIKTNGSLPREKRSPLATSPPAWRASPTGNSPMSPTASSLRAATPSEDELASIFNFEADFGRSNSLPRTGKFVAYPPFPNVSAGLVGTQSPPPLLTSRSPYENVGHHPGYAVPPSPRTRIRTTLGKDYCEILENKMVAHDLNLTKESSESSETTVSPAAEDDRVPPKPPRSPRIERDVLDAPMVRRRAFALKASTASPDTVICNSHFAPVTPSRKTVQRNHGGVEDSSPGECTPHWRTAARNIDSKHTKAFEKHMMKNIQETLNINDVNSEMERLKLEKDDALQLSGELRAQINEIERQENEYLRELEMERALLDGEVEATRDKLLQQERKLEALLRQSLEMEQRHIDERKRDQETIENCTERLEEAEADLEEIQLRKNCGRDLQAMNEEEKEILETLKAQHEAVDAERKFFLFYIRWKRAKKVFEDTEFNQMESEAHRESEREDLNKEIAEVKSKIRCRNEKMVQLQIQKQETTSLVCKETESLETQRKTLITQMHKERMRVDAVDRQFVELARLGVVPNGGQSSPTYSSDTEESCSGTTTELSKRLANLHLLGRSQEDVEKIYQVSIASPLECLDSTLGRTTSATLLEIETNRKLILAKQGAVAIDQERKRVEELKRRVAKEVKTQWEEEKAAREQREANCSSLNSLGSEDSSLTSSDHHTESLSSDDLLARRSSGEMGKVTLRMRQRETNDPQNGLGNQSRPLSETSSFCEVEGQTVKLRDKTRHQRPLTRYLPVRTEENFDLRNHIESAGHQIELCHHLSIDATSCRGYLHKLGSKFRTWQKRWFVFDRSMRALLYFSDKNEGKPKGGAYFQAIEEVYVNHLHSAKSPGPRSTFSVKTHGRMYQLMAPSPEAMRIWIDVIFTGAEGYDEFQGGAS